MVKIVWSRHGRTLSQEIASCAPEAWQGRLALVRIGKVWFTGPEMRQGI